MRDMGERWRVEDLHEAIWLVRRDPWNGGEPRAGAERLSEGAAAARVSSWFAEGWGGHGENDQRLAEICLSLEGAFPASGVPESEWLREVVRRALRDGRLVALRMPFPPPVEAFAEEREEAPPPPREVREEKTWIEIVLVEHDDALMPAAFKRYKIELPDGSVREGMLDEHGMVRLTAIDPGECRVSFPDFDPAGWPWGRARPDTVASRTTNETAHMTPSDGIEYASFIEHRVRTGESLASIAEERGLTWQDLAMFNFGTDIPEEVNRCLHEYTGCTRRTTDRKNYVFSDEDLPGIIYLPTPRQPLDLATAKQHRVQVNRPALYSRVELETVDDFGHRLGNVELTLRSENGWPDVSLHTGSEGYGALTKVRAGRYQVLLTGGEPAYMFDGTRAGARGLTRDDADRLVEAIIDTRYHTRAITRVVIQGSATEEERGERRLLRRIHDRSPSTMSHVEGRGEETAGETRRSFRRCVDNLALAAGWTPDERVNLEELVTTVLRGFLRDYHPTALARGYYVLVLIEKTRDLLVMSSAGHVERRFELADGLTTSALFGAYTTFEEVGSIHFIDMVSMSFTVSSPERTGDVDIMEIVSDPDGLRDAMNAHGSEVDILYYAPTAQELYALARFGGTGRLEDYGHDEAVNSSIHERNLSVCRSITWAHNLYVDGYIQRVKDTADEDALRRLGPPRPLYEMPIPAGATNRQRREILGAFDSRELDAWSAIAHQLDHFAGRLSEGYPYLRVKPKYTRDLPPLLGAVNLGAGAASADVADQLTHRLRPELSGVEWYPTDQVELEWTCDVQIIDGEFETITKSDALLKASVKLDGVSKLFTKDGAPIELSYKRSIGDLDKEVATVKIARLQIEADTLGKYKASWHYAPGAWIDSEMNTRTSLFGVGVTLKGKDFVKGVRAYQERIAEQSPDQARRLEFMDKYLGYLESWELQIQIGVVGSTEETVLSVLSLSPGFFQRRSIDDLFAPSTQWVDLCFDELRSLVALGWHESTWDGKYHVEYKAQLPKSWERTRYELSGREKIAIVHLGFHAYEEYGKRFKESVAQFADYRL